MVTSFSKIADFLLFLRKESRLSFLAVRGYCSTLLYVFKYKMPEICASLILRDLI